MRILSRFALFTALLAVVTSVSAKYVRADEVFIAELQADSKGGIPSSIPAKIKLSAVKPQSIKKEPVYRNAPQYGLLSVGDVIESQFVVVLDATPNDRFPRLYVDCNSNGDLTDEPAIGLIPPSADSLLDISDESILKAAMKTLTGRAVLQVRYKSGIGTRQVDSAVRFTLSGTELTYNREYSRTGKITINGKTFLAALLDEGLDGKFSDYKHKPDSPAKVTLLLDRNQDGRLDPKKEAFDAGKPFRLAGGVYEVQSINNRGTKVVLQPSLAKLKSTMSPDDLRIGGIPIDFDTNTVGGKSVSFPDGYPKKVVLLDFWATWCGPCIEEIPNIVAVYNQYHDAGFEILGISLDQPNKKQVLIDFEKQYGMTWPEVYDGGYWKSEIAVLYGVDAIPHSILVDGYTGKILAMGDSLRGQGLNQAVAAALNRHSK